jgi:hypothetical protein
MTSILSKSDLSALVDTFQGLCVSIYMPTHSLGAEIWQDPIRLKSLISDARQQLEERDLPTERIEALLDKSEIAALMEDGKFWQHQRDGLALFLSADQMRYYRLPLQFDQQVFVSDRPYLKPLMPLLTGHGMFFLLALSQNQVRLFQGSRHHLTELEFEEMPASLAEVMQYDEQEQQLQFHTSGQGRSPIYHGQGVGTSDDSNADLRRFCQSVDRALVANLKQERSPLVIAGVEQLAQLYRTISNYPNVLEEGVAGNPDHLSSNDLHQPAWNLVEPYFRQAQQQAQQRYHDLKGTGQASSDLQTVVMAAYDGQVDTLFVPVGQQQWGHVDVQRHTVKLHSDPTPESDDLLDSAALFTLMNSGTVYAVEHDHMPESDAVISALFRYPVIAGVGTSNRPKL